ncbi:hypothetical protein IJ096_01455 [Candidatus Saccharibacteria bacterium]|nr:hypothetical protein [Candidatus Saccharibacteria bacterium]
MSPDDKKSIDGMSSRDANNLHIKPEYGEQGEGPGEQGVHRVNLSSQPHHSTPSQNISGINSSRDNHTNNTGAHSIRITDVSEAELRAKSPSSPRFGHGEEDVMQYFEVKTTTSEPISPHPQSSSVDPSTSHPSTHPASPDAFNNPSSRSIRPESHKLDSAPSGGHPKKFNLAAVLGIILITVVITATAVFAALLFTQGSKENNITVVENVNTDEVSSITCKKDGNEEQRKSAGDATKMSTTVIANYLNGDLENYAENTIYSYATSEAATSAKKTVQEAYEKKLKDIGLTNDPFNSNYAASGTSLTVSHFADSSKLSFENMTILDIPQTNGTNPDISAIDKALSSKDYDCTIKSTTN